ncbi:hypothetical protein UFOVP129_69 [uncultured Caudovirales phage]|uniref:Uncharacterized protein n=1 Tax=uncultured Caudovirales phage TaxID=2100421 RepID=A0A6J5LI77_9CAUD|nr:hypothetical protein UFOVP129_69 [uncultured Caudovirales phage]
MINVKLAQHISNELWVQKSKVVEVLGKFEEEQPTIHAEKPSDVTLEERVKRLEHRDDMMDRFVNEINERLEMIEAPTLKRNLSIETADWKKVECLSWEDVQYFIEGYSYRVEQIIKNKLKK